MQMMKKVISVVLAVIMIASVFAFGSSATGAAAPSGDYIISMAYELVDEGGKPITTVTPGQTVKLYVYTNSSAASDEMKGFFHSIYFDENVYEFVTGSVEWLGIESWIDASNSSAEFWNASSSGNVYNNQAKLWTDEEKADEPNWQSLIYVMGTQDLLKDPYYVQENADKPMYSLTFKVSTDAKPGTPANFGCPASVNITSNGRSSYNYTKTTATGNIGKGKFEPSPKLTISVASADSSIVEWSKAQIRFHGVGSDRDFGSYENVFDVRTVAKITKANFDETFESEDNAKANITDLGFVYAAKSKVTSFDVDTAKSVAEGGSATDYVKKSVSYMQSTGDEYIFTCLITDIADADHTDGVNCLAFVEYNGEFYYFDAAVSVDYDTLYTQYGPNA